VRNLKLSVLFTCKTLGIFRIARWLTRRRLRILCYHGFAIGDQAAFRPKMFMTSEKFEKRLEWLRRCGMPVLPLHEAIEKLYANGLPDSVVVITVDDGFHSFHRLALPCLRRSEYPATVYVTTYYVEKGNPVFRLVVQYMFWKTQRKSLALKEIPWTREESIDLTDTAESEMAMWECIEYGENRCTEVQRRELCEELGGLLGVPYEEIVESRSFHLMTPGEIQSLTAAGISVGLHTHRHRFPADDGESARREILENKQALCRWITDVSAHFCYPSGVWREHEWKWLDDMGIKSSTTCIAGVNSPNTPRHALRRFLDGEDVHQIEFEASLSGFFELLHAARSLITLPRQPEGYSA
jgi:peptidoglycan/xylan/chitin deacetylase (PgdA/CDA1 family)